MKREKLNTLSEKDLLTGLITSDQFCREIIPVLNPNQLQVEYARTLSIWIKDYFNKFKQAPGKDIIKLYRSNCTELKDESLQDNILSFIENINQHYDDFKISNVDYAINQSISYLKKQSLKDLIEDLSANVDMDEISKAENAITKYRHVERSGSDSISLLKDTDRVVQAITNESTLLFEFPGAFGRVIGKFHREDFVAYLAPMKRGKTFFLAETGIEALKNGLKVIFFSCEMSQEEMTKRFWTALSGQLYEDTDDIDYPYFEKVGDMYEIKHKTISRKAVSANEVEKKQKTLRRLFRGGEIRLEAVPAYSMTVEAMDMKLDKLEQEGFIPDVIIIDYADIMMPSEKGEYRNQLDGIWKRLRGMAQKRKAVVFTASQSNRESLSTDVSATSIAEDVRKIAHVTSMVALNQNKSEKEQHIMRISQIALREGSPELRDAVCTQCYSIGRAVMESHFADEVILDTSSNEDDEDEDKPKGRKRR